MNFQDALVHNATLEWQHECAVNDLKAIVGDARGPMGLTPDSIKQTPEWKAAYYRERAAFNAIRDFNAFMTRNFKKEMRDARDAKRQAKLKGK